MLRAFGWRVIEIDGHDLPQILGAYRLARARVADPRPTALLAHTVKGKGLSFAEGTHAWHTGIADAGQLQQARVELDIAEETAPE